MRRVYPTGGVVGCDPLSWKSNERRDRGNEHKYERSVFAFVFTLGASSDAFLRRASHLAQVGRKIKKRTQNAADRSAREAVANPLRSQHKLSCETYRRSKGKRQSARSDLRFDIVY